MSTRSTRSWTKRRKTFPDTELMLCSGGGGRADYGALKYFHEFWPSDNTDPTMRVPMQWDYSYFFPPMALASHVTHWGNRPMHFACSVAMSARFGMDLDLDQIAGGRTRRFAPAPSAPTNKSARSRNWAICTGLKIRMSNYRGALNFVSPDSARAVGVCLSIEGRPAIAGASART